MRSIWLLILCMCTISSHAAVTWQAVDVWTDGVVNSNVFPTGAVIDQSGLSASYVTGVTEFYSYASTTESQYYAPQTLGDASGALDNYYFDLGQEISLEAVAIWNQAGTASLKDFDLYAATDDTFSTTTYLGSFSTIEAENNQNFSPGETFTFSEVTTRYLILDITANFGYEPTTRFNEIVFASNTVIPLPAAVWLFGSALMTMIAVRSAKNIGRTDLT